MMIDRRLLSTVPKSKKYIILNVALKWLSLCSNIAIVFGIAILLEALFHQSATEKNVAFLSVGIVVSAFIRFSTILGVSKMSHLSAKNVKITLRKKLYEKVLRLGASYQKSCASSEVVQVAVEGIDQLEAYFGSYLPQLFYSVLTPATLFFVLSFININAAFILLACVPLIPITIALVQTFAKKLLSKYWGEYTTLGDNFLENLQGLTTLKIYQADESKQIEMNKQAEHFRKITMRVLTMQLNSITVMDAISYGGAALGIILAVTKLAQGTIGIFGAVSIILLSAEFYIPMRLLGSFFHIAMNGMAAKEKLFSFLDTDEAVSIDMLSYPENSSITCEKLCFSYDNQREILHGINLSFPAHSFTAIVGESGCGKSTIASLFIGCQSNYRGSIKVGGTELAHIKSEKVLKNITYIGFESYIFKGSVRDNLSMGLPFGKDEIFWQVLEEVNLADFLRSANGLDTVLLEKGSNFSGGQRQRLALARGILHNSQVYIFDEATSNIDVESENAMMEQIELLAQSKTVILITHRLNNARNADNIYVIDNGCVKESGSHKELLHAKSHYAHLYETQTRLENFSKEATA